MLCPLCGKILSGEKFRHDDCWLSCSNCNVIIPKSEPETKEPIPQPEKTRYDIKRTETSLTLISPPHGHWAGWSRNAIWCATIFGHLGWMVIIVLCFCSCFYCLQLIPYYFSEIWSESIFLLEIILFGFILLFCFNWYCDWLERQWKQYRFCFHSDRFSKTYSNLLIRNTNEFKRSEIISIRAVNNRVCINRTCWQTEIPTETDSEACWLAYEIETFYRSPPPQSENAMGIMDQLFCGEVPFFAVYCPACGNRFQLNGECFKNRQSIKCQHCFNSFYLSPSNHPPDSTSSISFVSKRNDKNRIKVSSSKRLEVLAREEHGWNQLDYFFCFLCTIFLATISCYGLIMSPFIDLYQSGIFTLSFRDMSYDAMILIIQPFWSVPIGMILTLLFFQGSLGILRKIFRKWKLVLTDNQVEYSFGVFHKTIRVHPLTANLQFYPRNDRSETKKIDPSNPATKELNAVVINFGNDYFGELPCMDSDEVRRLCTILNEFYNNIQI